MATQLQLRKGTTVQNNAFTGAEGELVYDTDTTQLRIHNGVKLGGNLIDPIVEYIEPSANNNYTWVRKYASGWVEQGGIAFPSSVASGTITTITLPVEMSGATYTVLLGFGDADVNNTNIYCYYHTRTATGFKINTNLTTASTGMGWEVSGMAA